MRESDRFFSSRWGLILSVLGIAVGTGNIWRFPRIAAKTAGDEGAGAFLLAWVVFLLLWSVPLIIAEYAIGRRTRLNPVGSMALLMGPRYGWMGAFIAFVATAIMFYYSVVAGWCLYYFVQMLVRPLPLSVESAWGMWNGFQSGPWPVVFHALMMGVGAWVIARGVASIERVSMVLVPTLLGIVLLAAVRAVTLPGSLEGIRFLFTPDWPKLADPQVWLEALTQNAWDTGAGWGLILVYATYMRARHGVTLNAFLTGFGNNSVSLLAAIAVFGTVFGVLHTQYDQAQILAIMRDSGPASTGLTFIWMPQLFARMPLGELMAVLFFLGLSFAAFTSLISMIELATRVLVDMGLPRPRAISSIALLGFIAGLPSARSPEFLGNQDFVWGVALMLSGLLIALAVNRYGTERFRSELLEASRAYDLPLGRWWTFVMRYAVPLQALVLISWWILMAVFGFPSSLDVRTWRVDPNWWNPLSPYTVGTCVFQWLIVALALIGLNRLLVKHTLSEAVQTKQRLKTEGWKELE
ncbi:MAG: sodium-dependent transporter [Bacteroidetes bacterium]|nr:sodium-dependent transporter [Rhodothermia bacterium]MCS7155343.1 sodium-dependent transporter [Bacteroidota bacterium]MCX7907564.1 sodium-dependent transporter [Bacteroidota bacterium]MDW8138558.1 sodium-dependent transporter [Bacteroidota bacterium]MDW8284505.1 sodium-dependent transporter [Bacteroidota bacterium]